MENKENNCGCCCDPLPDAVSGCRCNENPGITEPERSEGDTGVILRTDSEITSANRTDHIKARLGINRSGHLVSPGLYRLGNPDNDSEVFVTANYSLSFDSLRSSLAGYDAWILVLDTKGVNVWCAAGKGTFGTEELISRINKTRLAESVNHRKLILPRLGASGIKASEVFEKTGFNMIWGTIRSSDLPEYLRTGIIRPEMKKVTFPLRDRIVLVPVEMRNFLPHMLIPAIIFALAGMWMITGKIILSFIAGTFLFPLLIFILPTKDFTVKGFLLGVIVMLPVAAWEMASAGVYNSALSAEIISDFLVWPAVTAFLALNFTGSTTFTSRSGVKLEIKRYTRPLLIIFIAGIILGITAGFFGGL